MKSVIICLALVLVCTCVKVESETHVGTEAKGGPTPYIVRWHVGFNNNQHTIKQRYFSDEGSARNFYGTVSSNYAKKYVSPTSVEVYSPSWAQYIPGGSDVKQYKALWHTAFSNEEHTFVVQYFDDWNSAVNFYGTISSSYAKKVIGPTSLVQYSESWSQFLPN